MSPALRQARGPSGEDRLRTRRGLAQELEGQRRFAFPSRLAHAEWMNESDRQPADPALRAAVVLARWLDGRFVDPLLGLFLPGIGDVLGSALGIYPIFLAWRRQAPKALVARMLLNLAVDALGGAIPIVGDLWDFLFRAHTRNLALLQARTSDGPVKGRPVDTLIVLAAALVLVASLAAPLVALVVLVRWIRG
jgi:hypothetical protein